MKAQMTGIQIECQGKTAIAQVDYWGAFSDECGLCGSHGEVEVNFICPVCDKSHSVVVYTW